jgi:hypothetical protein
MEDVPVDLARAVRQRGQQPLEPFRRRHVAGDEPHPFDAHDPGRQVRQILVGQRRAAGVPEPRIDRQPALSQGDGVPTAIVVEGNLDEVGVEEHDVVAGRRGRHQLGGLVPRLLAKADMVVVEADETGEPEDREDDRADSRSAARDADGDQAEDRKRRPDQGPVEQQRPGRARGHDDDDRQEPDREQQPEGALLAPERADAEEDAESEGGIEEQSQPEVAAGRQRQRRGSGVGHRGEGCGRAAPDVEQRAPAGRRDPEVAVDAPGLARPDKPPRTPKQPGHGERDDDTASSQALAADAPGGDDEGGDRDGDEEQEREGVRPQGRGGEERQQRWVGAARRRAALGRSSGRGVVAPGLGARGQQLHDSPEREGQ